MSQNFENVTECHKILKISQNFETFDEGKIQKNKHYVGNNE
mgnify:CR=1 FL=1